MKRRKMREKCRKIREKSEAPAEMSFETQKDERKNTEKSEAAPEISFEFRATAATHLLDIIFANKKDFYFYSIMMYSEVFVGEIEPDAGVWWCPRFSWNPSEWGI